MNRAMLLAVVVCLCAPAFAHASMFTPTASSSFFAGIGLWSVVWSAVYKIEAVAKMFGLGRFVNKELILEWINGNRVVTLLTTEVFNFGVHGIENPNSTVFALGGTAMNFIMIFVVIPVRFFIRRRRST
jgi:hypothetical protein